VDPKKFASRKFLLSLLGMGGYLVYCFMFENPVEPVGIATIIGTYGFVNAYVGKASDPAK